MSKGYLARLNKFVFPTDTSVIPELHIHAGRRIRKKIEMLHSYFRLLLADERIGPHVVKRCQKIARNSPQWLVAIVITNSLLRAI